MAAVLGLVIGYALHPLAVRLVDTAPVVTWAQVGVLFFVAAFLGYVAWQTRQALHVRRELMEPHRAMNRFVLARACALTGSFVAGGYAGYAVSWLGSHSELADQRIGRSAAAAVAGLLVLIASLLLERACRVPTGEPDA